VPDGGEDTFDRIRGAQMVPVFGREVAEGQQPLTVVRQAVDGLRTTWPRICRRRRRSRPRRSPDPGIVDLPEIGLHVRLHRLRHLVEDVDELVLPAPLMAGRRDLERLPEAERAVADGNFWRNRKSAGLQPDEQLAPALSAFAHTDLKAGKFLLAFRRRADDDQDAGGIVLHARLEIDPVGPDVDVAARR
jgi:hypothetical protein